ncbi:hypothetical protein J8378_28970, partial [Escherichia coli]|nr:hypothetical protein [Escherichia coli]
LAEKPDGKGSRSPFAIFPVRTVLPDTLIHEPDWHRDIAFLIQYSYLPRIYRGRQICFEK